MCKYVIKRNGKVEEFNVEKIKQQIKFACENTGISPVEFEAKFHGFLPEKLKTSEIQKMLLLSAIKEIDMDNPEWDKVGGRIAMWDIYGTVYKNTGIKFVSWMDLVKYLTRKGYYKPEIYEKLLKFKISSADIDYGTWKKISDKHPDFKKLTRQSLIEMERYLIKNKDGLLEYPFVADIANAAMLSETREEFLIKYHLLVNGFISLATPFKKKLRIVGGSLGSCYIGGSVDKIASIIKSWSDLAMISKKGGGVGWYLSKIRPSNTYTDNIPKANAITKWTKIINDIAIAVDQAGTRKAAFTLALDWWHMDLFDFIEAKSELKGDLRNKTFEIFPQVIVDNFLLRKAKNKEYVYQFNHYYFKELTGIDVTELVGERLYEAYELAEKLIKDGKLKHYNKIRANNLIGKSLWIWIETGDIYLANRDNLNKSNYLIYDEENYAIAPCANLCLESFSVLKVPTNFKLELKEGESDMEVTDTNGYYHSCNLISINVEKFKDLKEEEIKEVVFHAVDMLDKSIDITKNPVLEADRTSKALRNIGIGYLGLADLMAYNKLTYDTEEGRRFGMKITEKIAYHAYNASIELAKEKGSYPWFKANNYKKIIGEDPEVLTKISKEITGNEYDWVELKNNIVENGIRNFYLLAIAPNTSTGSVMGVSQSFLPVYNKFNYEEFAGIEIPVVPRYIKEYFWYYKTRWQYKQADIIKFTGAIQTFVDTGISLEININPDINTIDEIYEAILEEMLAGRVKAIYYSSTLETDNKQTDQLAVAKKSACVECAN